MSDDEMDTFKLVELQNEVLSEHITSTEGEWSEEMKNDVWRWCIENNVNPEHVENTLIRYSENFAPSAGGRPLALEDTPPQEILDEYSDSQIPESCK